jgi:hypothetical protein
MDGMGSPVGTVDAAICCATCDEPPQATLMLAPVRKIQVLRSRGTENDRFIRIGECRRAAPAMIGLVTHSQFVTGAPANSKSTANSCGSSL